MVVKVLFAFIYIRIPFDPVRLLIFLAVVAGEARVGLSLLVSVLRQRGKDKILPTSLNFHDGV